MSKYYYKGIWYTVIDTGDYNYIKVNGSWCYVKK